MRRRKVPLTDVEITRQAGVNPQYLQRHRDLRARAQVVRADLAGQQAQAALAVRSETEAALQVENCVLLEQNTKLRSDLAIARSELKVLRAAELAAGIAREASPEERTLRSNLEQAEAAARQARSEIVTLRNLNQRLMIENSRLLDGPGAAVPSAEGPAGQSVASKAAPSPTRTFRAQ
jgi:hypothetical protein